LFNITKIKINLNEDGHDPFEVNC